jgi:hypothetical protein
VLEPGTKLFPGLGARASLKLTPEIHTRTKGGSIPGLCARASLKLAPGPRARPLPDRHSQAFVPGPH